jgi:type IV fimbrial biogenesis protein FimT
MADKVKGFTLIELLVVVAIISLLSSVAIIGVERIMTASRLAEQRDRLLTFIMEARSRSVASYPHGVQFTSTGISLIKLNDTGNLQYDSGETTTTIMTGPQLPSGFAFTLNQCTADNILWFDRKGIPRCSNWSFGMLTILIKKDSTLSDATCKGADNTALTSDDDRRCKAVVVDTAGRVRYEPGG